MDFELDDGLRNLVAQMDTFGNGRVRITGEVSTDDIVARAVEVVRPVPNLKIVPAHRKSTIGFEVSSEDAAGPYRFDGAFYACFGGHERVVKPGELGQIRASVRDDLASAMPSRIRDLSFAGLSGRLAGRGYCFPPSREEYTRLGFYTPNGRMNITAYLLSDSNYVPAYVTRYGRYGNVVGNIDLGRRSLANVVTDVPEYVCRVLGEHHPVDPVVFKEVWTNACVHTDWRMLAPPSVSIYEDRIEVVSFGKVPESLGSEGIERGWCRPVNAVLYNIFAMLGYTWHRKHGMSILENTPGLDMVEDRTGTVTVRIPLE